MKKYRKVYRYKHGVRLVQCPDCNQWLPQEQAYYRHGEYADGTKRYHSKCKECFNADRKKRYDPMGKDSPCWVCDDLQECLSVLKVMVDVGDHYEPHPLPCYAEDVSIRAKTCPQCGTEFFAEHKSRVYCTDYCRHKAAKMRAREKVYES